MKEGIHPNYREVLFVDMSNDFKFITRSTINTRETGEFEGKTYPLAKIEVSSESHPFYTGQQKIMDTAGRVERRRGFAACGRALGEGSSSMPKTLPSASSAIVLRPEPLRVTAKSGAWAIRSAWSVLRKANSSSGW